MSPSRRHSTKKPATLEDGGQFRFRPTMFNHQRKAVGRGQNHLARASLPFLVVLIISLVVLSYVPSLVVWLPNLVMGAAR